MSTKFETQVNIDIHGDDFIARAENIQPVTIKWTLELEMRSWGLKGLYAYVPEQKITLLYTVWDESGDNEIDQEKEIILKDVQVDLDNVEITHGMAPQTLEFYKGQVALIF
jgi:hypothetical protein